MNLARIRRDIAAAQTYFDYVEGRATAAGGLMALIALQPNRRVYTLGVTFPDVLPKRYAASDSQAADARVVAPHLHERPDLLSCIHTFGIQAGTT